MVDHWNIHVPFVVGAVAVAAGILVLSTGHRMLTAADARMAADAHATGNDEEIAGEVADEFGGAPAAIDSELQEEAATRR
jgi:hypothetical protein